tara:strand:+ start:3260 stop:4117 length:858 start_codon:yes stop_codon:yes gene_type:complete
MSALQQSFEESFAACAAKGTELWKEGSAMTQYGLQVTAASIIASIGFSTNSETTVIGSMLISPIGGLIIDMGKGKLTKKQIALKTLLTLTVPFLAGMFAGMCTPNDAPSDVVEGRGNALIKNPRLWGAGAAVAAAAGILFAWSDGETPGIGIGIATALLPPIVAAGYATGRLIYQRDIVKARQDAVTSLEQRLENELKLTKELEPSKDLLVGVTRSDLANARQHLLTEFPTGTAVGNAFGVFVVNFVILLLAALLTTYGFKRIGCKTSFDANTSAVENMVTNPMH